MKKPEQFDLALAEIQAPKRWALNGGPFGSELVRSDYEADGIPVIRGVNLSNDGKFNEEDFVYVSEEKANKLLANNAHRGDVIFTQRGTLGQVGLIPKNSKSDRYVISQSQMKLTVDPLKAIPDYVYYYFRNPSTITRLENHALRSGVPHINLAILREFRIYVPPLHVQEKIAAILSAYDDLIKNNLRRIKILEEMAQSLYREWFVKFRFPGHEKVRMVDLPLGKIPDKWGATRFGDLAEQVRDGVMPDRVDPDTPYFGLEHFPRRSITLAEWGKALEVQSTKLLFRRGDILFGKIRPYFHKVGIAPVSGVCSSDTIVIRPKSPHLMGLVLGCASSVEFVDHATATSQGTKMPRANWDVLVEYPLPTPPSPILGAFNGFMSDVVEHLYNLLFRNRNLRQTRDLLLPRLISGEVDVSELGIAVPEEAEA